MKFISISCPLCKTCNTDMAIKQYKDSGIDCIRMGNMIFESEFFNKNRQMILDYKKSNPEIFERTFWT